LPKPVQLRFRCAPPAWITGLVRVTTVTTEHAVLLVKPGEEEAFEALHHFYDPAPVIEHFEPFYSSYSNYSI
jgi:hypothetical protein